MRNPVNRADRVAAEASGLPPYFYVIKRRDGDAAASNWLAIHSILYEEEEAEEEETTDDLPWSVGLAALTEPEYHE